MCPWKINPAQSLSSLVSHRRLTLDWDTWCCSNCFVMLLCVVCRSWLIFSFSHLWEHNLLFSTFPEFHWGCAVKKPKRNFGPCSHIPRVFVGLGVMNGASHVPPICALPAQNEGIITVFLAGRTHSQTVPDIICEVNTFCCITSVVAIR